MKVTINIPSDNITIKMSVEQGATLARFLQYYFKKDNWLDSDVLVIGELIPKLKAVTC